MAFYRNFRTRFSGYRQSFKRRYGATRGFRRGRAYGGYSKGSVGFGFGGYKVSFPMPMLAGVAVGLTDLDNAIPAELKIAAAVAPIQGRGINAVKQFAAGIIIGDIIQNRTGISFPVLSRVTGTTTPGNMPWGVNT